MKLDLTQTASQVKNIYILGSKPIQDWQRIILVCFAIMLGVFIWSYFFYFSVQSEFKSEFNQNSEAAPIKDKEAEIKDVVDKYKAKELDFTGTTTGASKI